MSAAARASVAAGTTGVAIAAWCLAHLRSPYVQQWKPTTLTLRTDTPLPARVGGSGDVTFLVLHGLGATADCFGAGFDRLASHGRVVMPDLLGFGRAIDTARQGFSAAAHFEALDATMQALGGAGPIVVAGHSLGGAVALRWAAHHGDPVIGVVTWGAPLHVDTVRARADTGSPMQRALAIDTHVAAWLCARMCRYRRTAAALAVASSPRTPPVLAHQAVLHTWPAYRDALHDFAFDTGWADALHTLDTNHVPVRLVWGLDDTIGDPAAVEESAAPLSNMEIVRVAGNHRYPLVHPDDAINDLTAMTAMLNR